MRSLLQIGFWLGYSQPSYQNSRCEVSENLMHTIVNGNQMMTICVNIMNYLYEIRMQASQAIMNTVIIID